MGLAPPGFKLTALYDWNKCVEILAYDLGYDWNTEEAFEAEDAFSYSTRRALFRETDPAFLFRFPGFVTSEELNELYGDDPKS